MPKVNQRTANRIAAGTSLIELLVVIVVFLVGILAMVQIFPGGFRILSGTRDTSISTTLGAAEMGRIRSNEDQMPEQVVPVMWTYAGVQNGQNVYVGVLDPTRSEDDLGPEGPQIDPTGNVLDFSGNPVGPWQTSSGANNVRRIIGEGRTVPAPRQVGPEFGGMMLPIFGPIDHSTAGSTPDFLVYGNDMDKQEGTPEPTVQGQIVQRYQYYVDDSNPSNPTLYIPQNPTIQHSYKLSMTAYVNSGGQTIQRAFVAMPPITVGGTASSNPYQAVQISTIPGVLQAGETLNSVDFDSIRLAILFDDISSASAGTGWDSNRNPDGTPENPFQYKLLDQPASNPPPPAHSGMAGLVVVNPMAYGYNLQTAGGAKTVLEVRLDYDVSDWRILKEDFRIPDTAPYQYQLRLTSLKHHNGYEPDATIFPGINVPLPNEQGSGPEYRDVYIMDMQTGGLYSKTSFTVNYSTGLITFINSNPNPSGPLQVGLVPPSEPFYSGTPTSLNAAGRTARIFYMAVGEWSTQFLKAASAYTQASSTTPPPGQFYIAPALTSGGSLPPNNGDNKIRFPIADVGKTVTIDELWYVGGDSQTHEANGHTFVVQKDTASGGGNPFISITDIDPQAQGADYSHGYAVRGVKGASVAVRVLHNRAFLKFGNSNTQNVSTFERWGRNWRSTTAESVLERGLIP